MRRKRPRLDEGALRAGLLIGLLAGGAYAQLRSQRSGALRRRDLLHFGAGTREIEMEASLEAAKTQARERRETAD